MPFLTWDEECVGCPYVANIDGDSPRNHSHENITVRLAVNGALSGQLVAEKCFDADNPPVRTLSVKTVEDVAYVNGSISVVGKSEIRAIDDGFSNGAAHMVQDLFDLVNMAYESDASIVGTVRWCEGEGWPFYFRATVNTESDTPLLVEGVHLVFESDLVAMGGDLLTAARISMIHNAGPNVAFERFS